MVYNSSTPDQTKQDKIQSISHHTIFLFLATHVYQLSKCSLDKSPTISAGHAEVGVRHHTSPPNASCYAFPGNDDAQAAASCQCEVAALPDMDQEDPDHCIHNHLMEVAGDYHDGHHEDGSHEKLVAGLHIHLVIVAAIHMKGAHRHNHLQVGIGRRIGDALVHNHLHYVVRGVASLLHTGGLVGCSLAGHHCCRLVEHFHSWAAESVLDGHFGCMLELMIEEWRRLMGDSWEMLRLAGKMLMVLDRNIRLTSCCWNSHSPGYLVNGVQTCCPEKTSYRHHLDHHFDRDSDLRKSAGLADGYTVSSAGHHSSVVVVVAAGYRSSFHPANCLPTRQLYRQHR